MKSMLFIKWLLTYLLLIALSLAFIFSLNHLYRKSMKEGLADLNRSYLIRVAQQIDSDFSSIDQLVYTLAQDTHIINLLNMKIDLTASDRYAIRDIARYLETFSMANPLIDRINFYALNPDFLIDKAGVFYSAHLDLYASDSFKMSAINFRKMIRGEKRQILRFGGAMPAPGVNDPPRLVYLQSLPLLSPGNGKGSMIILIDEGKLDSIGAEVPWEGKFLVMDESENILYSSDRSFYGGSLDNSRLANQGTKEIEIEGTAYIKGVIRTSYRSWSYVSLVPKRIYFDSLKPLTLVTTVMTACFFLLNLIIAYFLTYRMYQPVKRLISSIRPESAAGKDDKSEYDYIQGVIVRNQIEMDRMKSSLAEQRASVVNGLYEKLLLSSGRDSERYAQQLNGPNGSSPFENFRILTVRILDGNVPHSGFGKSRSLIRKVLAELLASYFEFKMVDIDSSVVCIIDREEECLSIEETEEVFTAAMRMIEREYNLKCFMGVSAAAPLLIDAPEAYRQSIEAVNRARQENHPITYFRDDLPLHGQYEFTLEQEYRLMHYIKAGSRSQASELLDGILSKNAGSLSVNFDYLHCLAFDLLGTIVKSADSKIPAFSEQDGIPLRRLMSTSDFDEMKTIVKEAADRVCELNRSLLGRGRKPSLEDRVLGYIGENFSDPDLNGSKLGEVFNMTPSYLSKLYKDETGTSILFALNSARIDAAKELLVKTNLSVKEVSLRVGYFYSNAFIRFFKKHTGMTPGQFKEMSRSL